MEHTQTPDSAVKNSKSRDNGAKLIFSDPILCAEFLRGYVDIDLLKEVQPEDIALHTVSAYRYLLASDDQNENLFPLQCMRHAVVQSGSFQ